MSWRHQNDPTSERLICCGMLTSTTTGPIGRVVASPMLTRLERAGPIRTRMQGLPRFVVTRGGEYCFFAGAQGPSLSRLTWRHGSNHSDVKTLRFRCEKNRSIRMNCRDLCSLQPKSANQDSVAKSKCIDPLRGVVVISGLAMPMLGIGLKPRYV